MTHDLVIRNVEVDGRNGLDVAIAAGRIALIGPSLAERGREELDGAGGALIPGLADHHIHLLALAAQGGSLMLEDVTSPGSFDARLVASLAGRPSGAWLRVTGYHESSSGLLDLERLDRLAPDQPVRVQHQTGSLWVLNSAALRAVRAELSDAACVERGDDGRPTGRIWRGDAWLRERLPAAPPSLASIGRQLAAFGITSLTDASVTTEGTAAARLAEAHRAGDLPQRLTLMSGGALEAPADGAFAVGPVKVLLDDHNLPPLDDFIAWIGRSRVWRRPVAVHCVTAAELAITLAAFETAGSMPGDRIEHGGVISSEAINVLRDLGLTVVTQAAFVLERGDRYLANVDPAEHDDLYRIASLLDAGIGVAGSSDAPYATPDPWCGMAAAVSRTTRGGRLLGASEGVSAGGALAMYLGAADRPAGRSRRVETRAVADLCLLRSPLADAMRQPDARQVAATIIAGAVIYRA